MLNKFQSLINRFHSIIIVFICSLQIHSPVPETGPRQSHPTRDQIDPQHRADHHSRFPVGGEGSRTLGRFLDLRRGRRLGDDPAQRVLPSQAEVRRRGAHSQDVCPHL